MIVTYSTLSHSKVLAMVYISFSTNGDDFQGYLDLFAIIKNYKQVTE